MIRIVPLLLLVGACASKGEDALDREVFTAQGELRRIQETGASPLNACRQRLATELERIRRGAASEKLSASGPAVCLSEGTFTDCARVSPKLVDACGRFPLDSIESPKSSSDRKRFLSEFAEGKRQLGEAAARAQTAKASMVYRERCTWLDESGIVYEDPVTHAQTAFATAQCTAEITVLDANLAPTETAVATATVKPTYEVELEKSPGEISNANEAARIKARDQARAAVVAKLP